MPHSHAPKVCVSGTSRTVQRHRRCDTRAKRSVALSIAPACPRAIVYHEPLNNRGGL